MSKASYLGANISPITSTFFDWLTRTNQMVFDMGTVVITVAANSTGETTTGNAHINGILSATTLVAGDMLRGGTVDSPGALTIGSNVTINAASFSTTANAIFNASALFNGGLKSNGSANVIGSLTVSSGVIANTLTANGTKTFGTVNTAIFTELANSSLVGQFIRISNTNLLEFGFPSLNDLSDVVAPTANTNDVLTWNGSAFIPAPPAAGSGLLSGNTITVVGNSSFGSNGTSYAINLVANTTASALTIRANTTIFNSGTVTVGGNTIPASYVFGVTGNTHANGSVLVTGGMGVTGNVSVSGLLVGASLGVTGNLSVASITASGGVAVTGNVSVSGLLVGANIGVTGSISVSGGIGVSGNVSAANMSASGNVTATVFIGSLSGTAANATLLNNQNGAYYSNGSNIATGTVPTARLGSGTANTTTVLTGGQAYSSIATILGFTPMRNAVDSYITDTAGGNRFYFTTSGRTFFNAPSNGFEWQNNGSAIMTLTSAGLLTASNDVAAFSDQRWKDNARLILNPLEKIRQIGGYGFVWNENHPTKSGKFDYGVLAQEVEVLFPEAVEEVDGVKRVIYNKLIPLLIESIKALDLRITHGD